MINSALPPELSFSDENWLAEQWLLGNGAITDASIDQLLMFAYMQKGVAHNGVTLEINRDDENNGSNPCVTYKVKLDPSTHIKWVALKKAEKIKGSIFSKAAILALTKAGAPYRMEDHIKALAKNYLPKPYKVEVQIVE